MSADNAIFIIEKGNKYAVTEAFMSTFYDDGVAESYFESCRKYTKREDAFDEALDLLSRINSERYVEYGIQYHKLK